TPLSTLHVRPHDRPRMTRGRCGSLLLHRNGLAPSALCRSPGAPDVGRSIAAYKAGVEASGGRFDPMQVGVTRAFFVADNAAEKEAALQRRLANRVRQLKLATRPDGTVHGGPDRATGDPDAVNRNSAIYGSPGEIAEKLDELRRVGVGYVLVNG